MVVFKDWCIWYGVDIGYDCNDNQFIFCLLEVIDYLRGDVIVYVNYELGESVEVFIVIGEVKEGEVCLEFIVFVDSWKEF